MSERKCPCVPFTVKENSNQSVSWPKIWFNLQHSKMYALVTTIYYINTSEIPSELSRENFISSHVKITRYLHTWRDHHRYGYIINRTFERKLIWYFTGVYIIYKQNITYLLIDQNFIFSCSTRYLTSEHSKDKFLSTCGHVISSSLGPIKIHWKYLIFSWHSAHDSIKSSQEISDLPWKSITKIWKLKQYKNRQTYQENVECIFAKSST